MPTLTKSMARSAIVLGLFAIIATAMVAFTNSATKQRVAEAKRDYTLRKLNELIPPAMHDNALDQDKLMVKDVLLDKNGEVPVYRVQKDGKISAVIISCVAPDGYSGRINLLVAIRRDGSLAGVRVTEHKETPGLGDAIDTSKSNWITIFDNKSLDAPEETRWRVRRDGGEFDQITSATITSRAVVKATRNALRYFERNKQQLLGNS
jgi:electron transport complex protein RnfG